MLLHTTDLAFSNAQRQAVPGAMLAGKLDVIAGVTFALSLMSAAVPFMPKKMLLRQIREMQEVAA